MSQKCCCRWRGVDRTNEECFHCHCSCFTSDSQPGVGESVRIFVNLLYCRCLRELTRDVRENRSLQQAIEWRWSGSQQGVNNPWLTFLLTFHPLNTFLWYQKLQWWQSEFVLQWQSGPTTYFNMLVRIPAMLGWWSIHRWSCSRLYHAGCILRVRDTLLLLWCVWVYLTVSHTNELSRKTWVTVEEMKEQY